MISLLSFIPFAASIELTHYWDCAKMACAWNDWTTTSQGQVFDARFSSDARTKVCDANTHTVATNTDQWGTPAGYACADMNPWKEGGVWYGYVASGGGDIKDGNCGRCVELQVSNGSGSTSTLRAQITNTGDGSSGNYDLLVAGGGIGASREGCPAIFSNQIYNKNGASGQCGTNYNFNGECLVYGGLTNSAYCKETAWIDNPNATGYSGVTDPFTTGDIIGGFTLQDANSAATQIYEDACENVLFGGELFPPHVGAWNGQGWPAVGNGQVISV